MENDQTAVVCCEWAQSGCNPDTVWVLSIVAALCTLFMAVTFLQSGFNKLYKYAENKAYFISQAEQTFLKYFGGVAWLIIVLLELCAGIISIGGIALFLINGCTLLMGLGCLVSAFTLICLLFGQRVAKDYAGAAALTGYFLVAVVGLLSYALTCRFC